MKASFTILSSTEQKSKFDDSVSYSNQIQVIAKSKIGSQAKLVWFTSQESLVVGEIIEDDTDNYIFEQKESKDGNYYTKMTNKL
jgi:hypothetical protein